MIRYIFDTIVSIFLMLLGLRNIGSDSFIVFVLSGIAFIAGLYLFFYELEWE
jgi:hypothetical protein